MLPTELRVAIARAWEGEHARQCVSGSGRNVCGRPAKLLKVGELLMVQRRHLDMPELSNAFDRPYHLDPARIKARLDHIEFVEGVFSILLVPKHSRQRIKGHPKAIAYAVGKDLLDVLPHLAADGTA